MGGTGLNRRHKKGEKKKAYKDRFAPEMQENPEKAGRKKPKDSSKKEEKKTLPFLRSSYKSPSAGRERDESSHKHRREIDHNYRESQLRH